MKVKTIETDEFDQEVLQSKIPVLVDFSAVWCGPCKAMEPIMEKIAEEQLGKCHAVKIDIDNSPEIASRYGVRAVPTVILFKDGKPASTSVGRSSKDKLLKMLE